MTTFISTILLMDRIKAVLLALETAPGVKLFERVEFYTNPDLVRAIQELKVFTNSICLIIPSANSYETRFAGEEVQTEAQREIALLMSDRDFGKRTNALGGDGDTKGVAKMNDMVEAALLGQNLSFLPTRIKLHPVSADMFTLAGDDKDRATGRVCWQMTWQASGGRMVVREKT